MAKMKARRAFTYAKQRLSVDQEFETKSERDAVLLEAARRASRVKEEPPKVEPKQEPTEETPAVAEKRRSRTLRTTAMQPEKASPVASKVDNLDRFYDRRDMEADKE